MATPLSERRNSKTIADADLWNFAEKNLRTPKDSIARGILSLVAPKCSFYLNSKVTESVHFDFVPEIVEMSGFSSGTYLPGSDRDYAFVLNQTPVTGFEEESQEGKVNDQELVHQSSLREMYFVLQAAFESETETQGITYLPTILYGVLCFTVTIPQGNQKVTCNLFPALKMVVTHNYLFMTGNFFDQWLWLPSYDQTLTLIRLNRLCVGFSEVIKCCKLCLWGWNTFNKSNVLIPLSVFEALVGNSKFRTDRNWQDMNFLGIFKMLWGLFVQSVKQGFVPSPITSQMLEIPERERFGVLDWSETILEMKEEHLFKHLIEQWHGVLVVASLPKALQNDSVLEAIAPEEHLNDSATWKHIRLFVVGDTDVGKTSLVRWLKGGPKYFIKEHLITDSIEEITTADVNTWESVHFDIKDYMADVMKSAKPMSRSPKTKIPYKPRAQVAPPESTGPQKITQTQTALAPAITIPSDLRAEMTTHVQKFTKLSQAFQVWDFAGQEEYYNTHHFFLNNFAIYVLVIDISKPFSLERVKFWIDSIRCYAEGCPIILVGTHADEMHLLGNTTDAVQAMENALMQLADYRNVIVGNCVVSCKDDPDPTLLRNKLIEATKHPSLHAECKLSWMLLYDEMSKYVTQPESNKLVVDFMDLETAQKIAAKYNIQNVKEALQFFHNRGFVLYYEQFHDWIFTKPMQLVSVFKKVFTVGSKLPDLLKKGPLTNAVISCIWNQYSPKLHPMFKKLLIKFGLAFPDPIQTSRCVSQEQCHVIIPYLLPPRNEDKFATFANAAVQITCTVTSVPPLGFVNHLLARIMELSRHGNMYDCELFQGACIFVCDDTTFCLTASTGEVKIFANDFQSVEEISDNLKSILQKVYETARGFSKTALVTVRAKCCQCKESETTWNLHQDDSGSMDIAIDQHHLWCIFCRNKQKKLKNGPRRLEEFCYNNNEWTVLCQQLDKLQAWRPLGTKLGFNLDDLEKLSQNASSTFSPTEYILLDWQNKKEATVPKLRELLVTQGMPAQELDDTLDLELRDVSEKHIYELAQMLDQPGTDGFKGAVILAQRMKFPPKKIQELLHAQHPTKDLVNHVKLNEVAERRKLKFIIAKLMQDPPMHGAADIIRKTYDIFK